MKRVWRLGIPAITMACGAAVGAAQSSLTPAEIPPAYAPPPGMCRVWLRDVPPVQQPAPTDCRSALRTKPVGATVIYGPESRRSSFSPTDWSRPSLRSARDDDRARPRTGAGDGAPSGDACTDGGHDARCDDAMTSMPTMRAAVLWTEGQRPVELQRWFGTANVAARFTMPTHGGAPDRVQWFDVDGRLVQIWTDRNGDGRADRVEIFNRDGARIRVVGQ